jgi:hypothetical protein
LSQYDRESSTRYEIVDSPTTTGILPASATNTNSSNSNSSSNNKKVMQKAESHGSHQERVPLDATACVSVWNTNTVDPTKTTEPTFVAWNACFGFVSATVTAPTHAHATSSIATQFAEHRSTRMENLAHRPLQ